MKTRELMSCKVATCTPSESLAAVAQKMWDGDIGMVVVIDAQSKPVGVVTDRDMCMAAYMRGCALTQATAASLLGRSVVACREDETVAAAAEAMALHQVRRLPVVDSLGTLVGVLTVGDISRAHRMTETAGTVLAVISTPRSLARGHTARKPRVA